MFLLFETLSIALFSSLLSYPTPVEGVSYSTYFKIDVAAHLARRPTGPPLKCRAARWPTPPLSVDEIVEK